MDEITRGRLAYIVDQAMMRRGLRPKYNKHNGYVAFHQLLKDYQRENKALRHLIKEGLEFTDENIEAYLNPVIWNTTNEPTDE